MSSLLSIVYSTSVLLHSTTLMRSLPTYKNPIFKGKIILLVRQSSEDSKIVLSVEIIVKVIYEQQSTCFDLRR